MQVKNITLQAFRGTTGFEKLYPIWCNAGATAANYYDLPQWHRAHLAHRYAQQHDTHHTILYLLVTINNTAAAIFPLHATSTMLHGLRLSVVRFAVEDYFDVMDMIVLHDSIFDVPLAELVRMINAQHKTTIDAFYFSGTPAQGKLDRLLDDHSVHFVRYSHHYSRYVDTVSEQAFDAALQGKFKRNLRRQLKNLQKTGKVRIACFTDQKNLAHYFDAFTAIEARGWKGRYKRATALAKNPAEYAFYKDILTGANKVAGARVHVLLLDDKPLAIQLCLTTNNTMHITKIAYDEDHARFSPGYLLMQQVLRNACRDPAISRVSFITDYPWNNLWAAKTQVINRVVIYNTSIKGTLAWLGGSVTMR